MHERIQTILTNLEATGEDLLALSDDIWLNIDYKDSGAVAKGAAFMIAFNKTVGEYREVSGRLTHLVEEFTQVSTFEAPAAPTSDAERERRERLIHALDRRAPHGLGLPVQAPDPVHAGRGAVRRHRYLVPGA